MLNYGAPRFLEIGESDRLSPRRERPANSQAPVFPDVQKYGDFPALAIIEIRTH